MALFSWTPKQKTRPILGERRTVRKLIICKRLGDEWRALGFEWVVQEFYKGHPRAGVSGTPVPVRAGWHDVAWERRV